MKQYGHTSKFPPLMGKFPPLTGCSSHLVMGNELLVCEILTWVPVKSLMRFKCVCKQWHSLIHTDRTFIDLHFTRSKTCNFALGGAGISLFTSWYQLRVFSSTQLLLSEGGVTTVEREIFIPGNSFLHVFGAVNGLFSVLERDTCSICVFNPSTGQSTPWIKSMIKQQHEKKNMYEEIQVIDEDGDYVTHKISYCRGPWFYFGYDPASKEHKVVIIWIKQVFNWRGPLPTQTVCEVMTVDGRQRNNNNLLWRRLDDKLSLPPTIIPWDITSSLYANGCIYWLRTCPDPLVVEFNVGSEKFRVISVPNYIIEEIRHPYDSKLIQIDGRLAVLALKPLINNKTLMKMCVLYDDVQHKKLTDISIATTSTSSADTVSDFHWIEETFMIPPFRWKPEKSAYTILAIPDTDLLIIKSEEGVDPSFYLYDWRKKSFSKDVQIILENRKTPLHRKTPRFTSFVYKESLLPVV